MCKLNDKNRWEMTITNEKHRKYVFNDNILGTWSSSSTDALNFTTGSATIKVKSVKGSEMTIEYDLDVHTTDTFSWEENYKVVDKGSFSGEVKQSVNFFGNGDSMVLNLDDFSITFSSENGLIYISTGALKLSNFQKVS